MDFILVLLYDLLANLYFRLLVFMLVIALMKFREGIKSFGVLCGVCYVS